MHIYPPGTEIGQYRVLSNPMMGGMGVVYVCHDLDNDRPVALKTFKPEHLPNRAARDRFLREGTAWVELGKHPHIVRCYEVQYYDPIAFLALELVVKDEGREDASLRSWLGQPLPLKTALLFSLQIARGLQHATHQIPGFVHRDLKPENVLVGQDKLPGTEVNRLRVTDFGLVAMLQGDDRQPTTDDSADSQSSGGRRSVVGGRTHLTHGIVGTPLYMAPEQWQGESVGVYTDVYALGCILYEMLTGEHVVNGRSITDLQVAHCQGHLRPMPKDLPGAVSGFLTRCLARQDGERYADWAGVLAALEAACAGQGVSLPAPQAEATSRAEQRDLASSYIAMGTSYAHLGNVRVAAGYFEKALGLSRAIGDRGGEGAALGNLGSVYYSLGDARRAIGYYEQCLTIHRGIGDRGGEGAALGNLGSVYYSLGDVQRAIEYYEERLVIAREIGDRRGEGAALGNLGSVYYSLGDVRRAIGYYEEDLKIAREIGDRRGEGAALGNLGSVYYSLGDVRRAIRYYKERLVIAREIGDRRGEGTVLNNLGEAYRNLGDARRAIGYYEQCLTIHREIGDRGGEGAALGNLGSVYYSLSDAQHAIEYYEECLTIKREIGDRRGEGAALVNLGNAYAGLGDAWRAIGYYEGALKIAREIGDQGGEDAALGNLGSVCLNLGDARRAIGYIEEHLKIAREIGDLNGVAIDSYNIANLYRQQGEIERAIPLAQEAARLFAQIGHAQYAQQAQQLVAQLQGGSPAPAAGNPAQAAFEAFQRAGNLQEMQAALAQHPLLKDPDFHAAIERAIREQVPEEDKPAFEERLAWLKQLSGKQTKQTDLFGKNKG